MKNKKYTSGGFIQIVFILVVLFLFLNYFHIGPGEVVLFIVQILNYIFALMKALLVSFVGLAGNLRTQ